MIDVGTRNRKYFMRITIEVYDGVDAKTRRYAVPAERLEGVFDARDDDEARVLQARCWQVCGVAVYNELYDAMYGNKSEG